MTALASATRQPSLLTVDEVADTLRVHRATVLRRIADGTLRSIRLGAIVRVPASELARLGLEPPEAA